MNAALTMVCMKTVTTSRLATRMGLGAIAFFTLKGLVWSALAWVALR